MISRLGVLSVFLKFREAKIKPKFTIVKFIVKDFGHFIFWPFIIFL
jgi:hypothetical protein